MRNFVLTSTSVTDGHPDKLCDRISDAIVDAYLTEDPGARVIAECALASGIAFVAANASAHARLDLPAIVRRVVQETEYDGPGFESDAMTILTSTTQPPPVVHADGKPQAIVSQVNATLFGFACNHSKEMLPLPIVLAHRLARGLRTLRAEDGGPLLHPDGQAQVALRHEERKPTSVEGVALSVSLRPDLRCKERLDEIIREKLVDPILKDVGLPIATDALIELIPELATPPRGPSEHAGLTGRKNDIDTYGGYCRQSASALSGKDPNRADRIGAYAARYAAKNVISAGLAEECEVQISYALGKSDPISVEIDTFGSGSAPEPLIREALVAEVNFCLGAIIERFQLGMQPRSHAGSYFSRLGAYGHFGREDIALPWEKTDLAEALSRRF